MGTKFNGNEDIRRSLNTFIKLQRSINSVSRFLSAQEGNKELSVTQFGILESLYHLGPMSQKALGNKILKTKGNISFVVRNLLSQELISRMQNADDGRFYEIRLMPKGKKLIQNTFPGHAEAIHKAMGVLTAMEQETMQDLCKKLGTTLDKKYNQYSNTEE